LAHFQRGGVIFENSEQFTPNFQFLFYADIFTGFPSKNAQFPPPELFYSVMPLNFLTGRV